MSEKPNQTTTAEHGVFGPTLTGFHCYDNRKTADRLMIQTLGTEKDDQITGVLGCVEVSGTVIKHRSGYRAERATIQSLTAFEWVWEEWDKFGWMRQTTEPLPDMIHDFESTYQVDVSIEMRTGGDRPFYED